MSSPIYRGPMVADPVGAAQQQQEAAETRNARPEVDDMNDSQEANAVRLDGLTGESYPGHVGTAVPNLSVTRVSSPARTHSLPSNVATDQSQLRVRQPSKAPARPHGTAGETRGRGR